MSMHGLPQYPVVPKRRQAVDVLTPGEVRLGWTLRLGWAAMGKSCWPGGAWRSAFYGLGIARQRCCRRETFFFIIPWVIVWTLDLLALVLVPLWSGGPLDGWVVLLPFWLLLTPVMPLLLLAQAHGTVRRQFFGPMSEQLRLVPINSADLMYAPMVRPVGVYGFGVAVETVLAAGLWGALLLPRTTGDLVADALIFIVLVIIGIRAYLLRSLGNYAAMNALRAGLMLPGEARSLLRALRDALLPGLGKGRGLVPVVIGSAFLYGGLFILSLILLPVAPFISMFLAAGLEERAGQVLSWLRHFPHEWAWRREAPSGYAPQGLWAPWDIDYRKKPRAPRVNPLIQDL